jgi:O-antigen/teichoic acid export membrane protein
MAFAVTFHYTASPAIGVLALCGAWIAILIVYDFPTAWRELPVHTGAWSAWSWTTASRLVWLGVPGGILSWLVALQTSVPRYLIQQDVGEAALGVYSAIASLFVGLELAVVSFNQAAVPQMARYAAERQSAALSRLVRQLTFFGVGLGCLFVVAALAWGPTLLGLLFGSAYAAHADVLAILTIGFAIRTATMPTGMTLRAINAFWPLVAVQFSAVIAVVAACLVLMPRFGLAGCAAACVVGYAFDSLGRVALHFQLVARPKDPVCLATERLQAA